MYNNEQESECSELKGALSIIGDRWSVVILWSIQEAPRRFVDIQKATQVNSRTLAQRLQALEDCQMIEKHEYKEYPPRTEYSITPKGAAIRPIIDEMMHWAQTHGDTPAQS